MIRRRTRSRALGALRASAVVALVALAWGAAIVGEEPAEPGSSVAAVELAPNDDVEPVATQAGAVSRAVLFSATDDMSGAAIIRGELTIEQSVTIALAQNPQLQAVREETRRAGGALAEARSGFLPDINLTGQYYRRVDVPGIAFGPVTTVLGSPDNWGFGATLTQPLFLGGSVLNAYRAARVGQEIAEENIRQATQDVIFQVRRAYYNILLNQELVGADREQLERAKAFLADVEKQLAQGTASNFDVLRARVEEANVKASLIQAQNALHLAGTSFLRGLGVSQDSEVTLVDTLDYHPLSPEVRQAMRQALLNRPEVLAARLAVKAQQHRVEGTKAGLLPRVFLAGDYQLTKPAVGGFGMGWDDEFRAIVSVEFPLFEGGETSGKLAQERAVLEQFRTIVRDSEEQVLLEVTQAFLSLEDADEFVRSQLVNLEQAREGLRLAEVGYREGVTKQVEVLDARTALGEARKNFSQAVFNHMVAKLSLDRATGMLATSADEEEGPR